MNTRTCATCGSTFESDGVGRPRLHCFACSPRRRPLKVVDATPCASCGKPSRRVRCDDCRAERHRELGRVKRGVCGTCGKPVHKTRAKGDWTPPAVHKCRDCRRKTPKPKAKPKGTCVDCGASSWSTRCRACADLKQRVRSGSDHRVQRRDRERAAPGLSQAQRSKLLAAWIGQGRACIYCSEPAETIDHVVPLVRGGTNREGNLAPCCRRCNGSKSGWLVVEWRTGKRIGPMANVLAWKRREPRAAVVKVPVQRELQICPVCSTLHSRRKYCGPACNLEGNRRDNRERYRASVGLPPTWNKPARPRRRTREVRDPIAI